MERKKKRIHTLVSWTASFTPKFPDFSAISLSCFSATPTTPSPLTIPGGGVADVHLWSVTVKLSVVFSITLSTTSESQLLLVFDIELDETQVPREIAESADSVSIESKLLLLILFILLCWWSSIDPACELCWWWDVGVVALVGVPEAGWCFGLGVLRVLSTALTVACRGLVAGELLVSVWLVLFS